MTGMADYIGRDFACLTLNYISLTDLSRDTASDHLGGSRGES